jgi:outer membrane protein assembly factor BamB
MKHKALILFLIIGIAFLFSTGCKKNKAPETPDKPSGPAVVALDATNEYTTKAKDPDGDDIIYTFDWGDDATTITDPIPSESIAIASHAWDSIGTYWVKVKAQDEKDLTSDWSDSLEVTVKTNNPPNKPFIIGEPYGRPNRQYTFKTIVTDPNGDSVAAKFFWGDGRTPTWSAFRASGDTIIDTITYTQADTYQIRVVAKDILGSTSDTSNVFNFIVSAVAWSFLPGELGEEFNSSPALITSGNAVTHVIVGCNDGYVYCLDSIGDSLWVYPPVEPGDAFNASPLIGPDNKIYIGDEEGMLHGINPNGTPFWDPPLMISNGYYLNSSPAINAMGDMIYVGCENETLYAINTGTGSIEWKFGASAGITASPAIATDGAIVFGDENDSAGRLYILNPDGTERHTFYAAGPIFSSPAINGDTIYFAASETLFYAIDMNGNLLYTYLPEVQDEVFSSPTIGANGIVYFGDLTGRLYALNSNLTPVTTGNWPILITDEITSSAAIGSDNLIYFVGNDDYLYAYNSAGILDWSVKLGAAKSRKQEALKPSPAIGPNGWIYVASENGIYAFKRNITLATNAPWPMFRHDLKHTGRVGGGKR